LFAAKWRFTASVQQVVTARDINLGVAALKFICQTSYFIPLDTKRVVQYCLLQINKYYYSRNFN